MLEVRAKILDLNHTAHRQLHTLQAEAGPGCRPLCLQQPYRVGIAITGLWMRNLRLERKQRLHWGHIASKKQFAPPEPPPNQKYKVSCWDVTVSSPSTILTPGTERPCPWSEFPKTFRSSSVVRTDKVWHCHLSGAPWALTWTCVGQAFLLPQLPSNPLPYVWGWPDALISNATSAYAVIPGLQSRQSGEWIAPLAGEGFFMWDHMRLGFQNGADMLILNDSNCLHR